MPGEVLAQQINLFQRQTAGMMMHDGRSAIPRAERKHLLVEIASIKAGKDRRTASAIPSRTVTGGTGRSKHLDMGMLRMSMLWSCLKMKWQQQQHKQNCLARQTRQAIVVNQGIDQYRLIKAVLVTFALAAVILGAGGFQNGYSGGMALVFHSTHDGNTATQL